MITKMIHSRLLVLFAVALLFAGMANAQPTTTISVANIEASYGTSVNVPVTTTGIPGFVILQLRIAFNPDVMTFTGIANRHTSLSGMSVGEKDGVVNFSFFTMESRSIGSEEKLFDLVFDFCSDLDVCLAAGGSSDLSFFGGTEENYIQDFDEDLGEIIDYVTTTVDGSVYSNSSVYNLTINTSGNGEVLVDGTPYTAPVPIVGGTEVVLQAQADTDWRFVEWTGDLTGDDNPANLLMNGDKEVTAVFSDEPVPQYELTINQTGLGDVTVNGTTYTGPMLFDENTEVTIAATPETGYDFSGFSGDLTAATSPQTITMNSNKNINATFTIKTYTLTINIAGSGTVEVNTITYTTPLIFEHGDTPSLEAIPGDFHDFEGWSGSLSGAENPKSITMDGNKTVTASFTPFQYTLTINITGSGSVTVDGTSYSGPMTLDHGENPSLSAVAPEGWQFDGWSGDLTGTANPQNILMDGNKVVTATFSIKQYTLSIEQNGNGTVLVNGDPYTDPLVFNHGDTPELHALPDENWQFIGWSGDLGSSTTPQSLVMNSNKSVTANFALKQYTLTINIFGDGIVGVDGSAYSVPLVFDHGSTPSLEAIADEFNNFDGWSGDLGGSDNPQNIEMTANRTVTASFSPFQYTLEINTSGNGSVTVNGGPYTSPITFDHGDTPLIQANADSGWQFSGWTGNLESFSNPVNLLMDGNKNITANFELRQYTLTVNVTGSGTVYVNGNEYSGPVVFNHGDTPSLQAVTGDFHNFSGWGGDLTGNTNPEALLMDGNKTVQAFFSPFEYTLTIDTSGQGMVEVNGVAYTEPVVFSHGDQPQIRAYADTDWQFDEWSGDLAGNTNPQNLLMDGNKQVTAHFSEIPPDFYTLTVSINGGGHVLVNSTVYTSPMGFEDGTELTLEAIPDEGWVFTGWSGDLSGAASTAILTMADDKNITATFERQQYTLTTGLTGAGEVWVNGALYTNTLSFAFEDTPQIQAIPDEGWLFDSWSGDLDGADNPIELFMDDDKSVIAHFTELPSTYTLTIATQGNGSVTVDGNTYTNPLAFQDQETATLEAIPDDGWFFDGWSGDLLGDDNPDDLLMDGHKSVTALFTEIPPATFILTVTTQGSGSVLVDGNTYTNPLAFQDLETATLEAIPDDGWFFDGWSGDLLGDDNPDDLLMDGHKSVTPLFTEIPPATFTLTVTSQGNGSINVNGDTYSEPMTFEEQAIATLEAIPDDGWFFDGWSGDLLGDDNPDDLLMDGHKSVTALFTEIPPATVTLTLIVFGEGSVSVNGTTYTESLVFEEGTSILLEATADQGWQFDGWSGDLDGEDNPASLLMDEEKAVIASFSEVPPPAYSITFVVANESNGTPIDDAVITLNETTHTPGLYFFDDMPPGEYQYTVSKEGYLDVGGVVSLTDDDVVEAVALESTVNIADVESLNLKVYPNPARDNVFVESDQEITGIELFNLNGQILLSEKLDLTTYHQLNVSRLDNGIYLLRILTRQHVQTVRLHLNR